MDQVLALVLRLVSVRDSNPGPVFSIPGFGIGEFLMSMSMSMKYLYSAKSRRSNLRRWHVSD